MVNKMINKRWMMLTTPRTSQQTLIHKSVAEKTADLNVCNSVNYLNNKLIIDFVKS